jgi:hypothetical protein
MLPLTIMRRKAAIQALQRLPLLLPALLEVSQVVVTQVSRSPALARGLLLEGSQHLAGIHVELPHLPQLGRWISQIVARGDSNVDAESDAVQALLELCLGLVLRWLGPDVQEQWNHPPNLPHGSGSAYPEPLQGPSNFFLQRLRFPEPLH